MLEQASTPYSDAGGVRHHPLIALHASVAVPCPDDFDCDFLGVRTRRAFYSGMMGDSLPAPREPYPRFDEEYFEWVDILEAVDQAAETFVMIELGAGYGRWCARAAAAVPEEERLSVPICGGRSGTSALPMDSRPFSRQRHRSRRA